MPDWRFPPARICGFTAQEYSECADYAQPPKGWTKWVIPGYEYLYVERDSENTFPEMLAYLEANAISLAGAVHDFTCPETGKQYMFFPIRRL